MFTGWFINPSHSANLQQISCSPSDIDVVQNSRQMIRQLEEKRQMQIGHRG